jgi:hypothetical protein
MSGVRPHIDADLQSNTGSVWLIYRRTAVAFGSAWRFDDFDAAP